MNKALPNIKEDISQLEHMLKTEKDTRLKERILALYLLKTEQAKTRISVAKMLAKYRTTIGDWLKTYEKKGMSGLLTIQTHSNRKSSIPPDVLEQLKQKLKNPEGFNGYKAIQMWIATEFNITVSYKTLHNIVRYRLKSKPKVGRKTHIKKTNKSV
jgi:putative transposase